MSIKRNGDKNEEFMTKIEVRLYLQIPLIVTFPNSFPHLFVIKYRHLVQVVVMVVEMYFL